MKFPRIRPLIVVGTISSMSILCACSTSAKRKWLTTFFDGVPPEKPETAAPPHPPAGAMGEQANLPPTPSAVKAEAGEVMHPPFRDHQCDGCHESEFSQKLRAKPGELCFLCHDDFLSKAKYKHAPAEAGDCLNCHHPHKSSQKFLLVREGQQVCLECHDKQEMAKVSAHARIGEAACQTCHNPHSGEWRYFLKPDAQPDSTKAPGPATQ